MRSTGPSRSRRDWGWREPGRHRRADPERPAFTRDEEISLQHLEHYLGKHDKYLIAPTGTSVARAGFEVMTFRKRYFGSAQAHARLQLSEEFYTRFLGYKYILMHHLDALVLSDRLTEWCETDLDFVGAPWLPCEDSPWVSRARVGNSGFALMKVESFLEVIRSKRPTVDPDEYLAAVLCRQSPPSAMAEPPEEVPEAAARLQQCEVGHPELAIETRQIGQLRLLLGRPGRQVLAGLQDCLGRPGPLVRL